MSLRDSDSPDSDLPADLQEYAVTADLVSPMLYEPDGQMTTLPAFKSWWKGASGLPEELGSPPPDIILLCLDEDRLQDPDEDDDFEPVKPPRVELTITWSMSWSDVLDLLQYRFGRAVYFEYADADDPVVKFRVADEREFDIFCCVAEKRGLHVEVDIKNATMKASDWIWAPPQVPNPYDTAHGVDLDGWNVDAPAAAGAVHVGKGYRELAAGLDEGVIGEDDVKRARGGIMGILERIKRTLADAPRPPEQIAMFGGGGLLLSTFLALYLYMFTNINSIAAVTLSLPCNIFFISLLISEVEEGFSPLFKMGIAFVGFWVSILVVLPCLMVAREWTAAIPVPLWAASCFWYMELIIRALGWPNWLTGVYNLYAWVLGGCGIPGVRKREKREHITILGDPPEATAMTAMMSLKDRHPGATFLPAHKALNMKVCHIGYCLGPGDDEERLSKESNMPLGPFREGIINPKTARQLRKWITRAGKQDDGYLKAKGRMGIGRVKTVSVLGTKVEWLDPPKNTLPVDYLRTGDDKCGFYELLLCEEEDTGPPENRYDDGELIHDGGNLMQRIVTFACFFIPQVAAFIFGWALFFGYFGMLYFFEISLVSHALMLAQGSAYAMPGRLYNAQAGDKLMLHVHCKGFTKNSIGAELLPEDGRPPVIIESMEAVGMGVAMHRLQDLVAENGICCVYDRIGFGWSTSLETYREPQTNRTPTNIAAQLHYALTLGVDPHHKRGITWSKTVVGHDNESAVIEVPIKPPFILVAASAGALYARQFAHDYPQDVAGLVLVDSLPAINNEDASVRSAIQKALSPMMLMLCHRYLQPMGMMNNVFSSFVLGLFSEGVEMGLQGGIPVNGSVPFDDYKILTHFMFKRAWCPSVAAEYKGLFHSSGNGIETVAAADKVGYPFPTVLWVREVSWLDSLDTKTPYYEYTVGDSKPSARRASCTSSEQAAESAQRAGAAGCLSWLQVQESLVRHFPKALRNPHNGKVGLMRGVAEQCELVGCNEYTMIMNPSEILDAVLDVWWTLGFAQGFPSKRWYFELGGSPLAFDEATFKQDLSTLLSHVLPFEIVIIEGPVQGLAPLQKWEMGADGDDLPSSRRAQRRDKSKVRAAADANNWYSGPLDPSGSSAYKPIKNDGAFHVGVRILGHKPRSTGWSESILKGREDVKIDSTAASRRGVFMRKHRVLSVREQDCVQESEFEYDTRRYAHDSPQDAAAEAFTEPRARRLLQTPTNQSNVTKPVVNSTLKCKTSTIDIFVSSYMEPIYHCPQNSYRDFRSCVPCDLDATSATGSLSPLSCYACASSQHLTCEGNACQDCPPGFVSNRGSLTIAECKPFGSWLFAFKGPLGKGSTSQAITPHREQRVTHKPFDREAFFAAIAAMVGSHRKHIRYTGPTPMVHYPESRAMQLNGATIFELELTFAVNSTADSDTITNVLLGNDHPSDAKLRQAARKQLFADFQVLRITSVTEEGSVDYTCPVKFVPSAKVLEMANIFLVSYFAPTYMCPSSFYRSGLECKPCPDSSTSDIGAASIEECLGFVTIIFAMKDPSVSYSARTDSNFGAALDAQPNAYHIMNYTGMRQSATLYSKIRGYAIQPLKYMDALFPERGFQTNLCFDGLNCFNSSEFRRDLSSALNGLVQPNEVRLLPPQDCKTPENSVADFCGLWPRYPLYAANQECVCSHPESVQVPQVDQFVAYKQKCFFTIGPSYIGLNIGLKVDSDSQVELLSHRAATVGDCADWCAETRNCHAFLYHHSLLTCELRQGQSLGQEAASAHCPSTSKACLERVLEAIFPLDSTGLIPGMQMYFLLNYPSEDPQNMPPPSTITPERYRMCRVLSSIGRACRSPSASKGAEGRGTPNRVFDELENPIISARGGTGMHSPSDSMYAVVRLRADTATMLSRALDILRNGEASQYGAGQGRFTDFLKRRNVLQIFESVDKKVTAPVSTEAAFIPAERNLMDSKNLLCGAAAEIAGGGCKYTYLSSSAWCDKAGKPTNVARCSASHNHKPFCHVVWGTVRAYVQQVVCPEGKGSPECSAGGVPSCSNADNLFDDDSSGPETVWEANEFEAGVEADFVTVSFSNDISQHVDYVEVTRIDVQELQEVESGEADSLRVLELVFSDGKTQQLNLAGNVRVSNPAEADVAPSQQRGSATMQVFYIEPAVTHLLTIRIPRNFYEHQSTTPRRRGLRVLRVWGQPLSAVWQGSIIQMDKPGYTASGALDCPPTTFYSPNRHSCVHCPYPKVSRGKSSTAFRENEIKDTESIAVLHDEPACTCPVCGDGGLQWEGDEKCDDGNTANDDGCDSSCKVEVLWLCTGPVDSNLVGLPEDSYKTPDQCFRIGSAWVPFGEMAVPGGPRFGAAAILHNDAMWLFGGMSSGYRSTFATGVAEATNGANCLLRAPSDSCDNFPSGTALEWLIASGESYTPWSGRAFLSAVTFQENVFVLGGLQSECSDVSCEPSLTLGDVWKSTAVSNVDQSGTSFIDWAQVTPQAAWSSRARAAVVVFKNAIWLLGGQAISGPRGGRTYRVYNDVWVSSNGADWTRLLLNAGWSPRCGHTSLVFANQNREAIYVMGGSDTSRYFNDVWMSYTGTNWTRLTASASFPGRWLHTSLVFRNNLWVIGGHSCVAPAGTQDPDGYGCTRINKDPGNFYNDVWFSSDGVTWRASTQNAKWSPRAGHSSIVFPSKGRENIWVIGGYHAFGDALNDTFAAFTF